MSKANLEYPVVIRVLSEPEGRGLPCRVSRPARLYGGPGAGEVIEEIPRSLGGLPRSVKRHGDSLPSPASGV
jgi:hypothetical protein